MNATGLVGLNLDGNDLSFAFFANSSVKLPLALPLVGRLSSVLSANYSLTIPAGNYSTEPLASTIFNLTLGSLGAEQGFTPEVFASARVIQLFWAAGIVWPQGYGVSKLCPFGISETCCNSSLPFGWPLTSPWCAMPAGPPPPRFVPPPPLPSSMWLWAGPPYQPIPTRPSPYSMFLFPGIHFGPSTSSFTVSLRVNVAPGLVQSSSNFSSYWFSSCATECTWPFSPTFPSKQPTADPSMQDFWGTVYL